MQTTAKTRRLFPVHARQMAIALAIAVGVAGAGVTAMTITDDGSAEAEPVRIVHSAGAANPMFDYQFLEQNFHLPVAPESAVVEPTAPDWRVLEQNSWGEDFILAAPEPGSYYPSVDDVPQYEIGEVNY